MNLAVKLYAYVSDKPAGIPDAWPATAIEIGDGEEAPSEQWTIMSRAQYDSYLAQHQEAYDTWHDAHVASIQAVKDLRQQLDDRIHWGKEVVKQFRMVTMGVSDEAGLVMLANLMDVKTCLDLGMLAAAAEALTGKDPDDTLDALFQDGKTLRQYFIDLIMTGGAVP